ncbi:MAG TPA: PIN domain-containing protein [Candidatus Cloacimonadota bacterium]|nr:PIN domain-containing protein [Candidatus Cloacimonadota bacterium]
MKETLFWDTNVVLDLLGERDPFYISAARIASLADNNKITIVVSALTFSTVFYVLSKFESKDCVKEKLRKFKIIVKITDLSEKVIEKALASKFTDFEDALQYFCAEEYGCDILITRDAKDFKNSSIPILSPNEYLSSLELE